MRITVITVCYNAEESIERAIKSVIGQDYEDIEYVIIDGASTDHTIEIISRYERQISVFVSEPDAGIYDAMNKGIERATGDFVYFLGADDWLIDSHVVSNVVEFIQSNLGYSLYMGGVILYHDKLRLIKKSNFNLTAEDIKHGHMCPHQGLFSKRSLFIKEFDTRYKIAADYEFVLRNVVQGTPFCMMQIYVAYYSLFGVSESQEIYNEYESIIRRYLGERYLNRIEALQKKVRRPDVVKSLIKRILINILGERRFFSLLSWNDFDTVKEEKNGINYYSDV